MSALRAGCWNKPRPTAETSYFAQNGYDESVSFGWGSFTRTPLYVPVKHVMSIDCQSLESATASCCVGCEHAKAAP